MSRADGVLRVVLTGKRFDMIESGEKLEEYRGKHWAKRLLEAGDYFCFSIGLPLIPERTAKMYHTLVASRGYTSRTLTRKIKRIRWGKPNPAWTYGIVSADECFIIELEAPE